MSAIKMTPRQRRKLARKDPDKRSREMIARIKRSKKTILNFDNDHREVTDVEIREMALAIFQGSLFTSWQIPDHEDLGLHFMPMLFMTEGQRGEVVKMNPGVIVAPMTDALETGLNGYPVFSSAKFLSQADSRRLIDAYNELKSKIVEFQGENHG